jgi:hypothetical protein
MQTTVSHLNLSRLPNRIRPHSQDLYKNTPETTDHLALSKIYRVDAKPLLQQIKPKSIALSVWSPQYLICCIVVLFLHSISIAASIESPNTGSYLSNTLSVADLESGACAYLRFALPGKRIGQMRILKVVDCDAPVFSAPTSVGYAAAVAANLEVDGPPAHGAFLFVQNKDGWRLTDDLLEPEWTHGGYCKPQFSLRWGGDKSTSTLTVMAERICYLPLDNEEAAAGESSVASSECRTLNYIATPNGLKRKSATTSYRRCQFKHGAN